MSESGPAFSVPAYTDLIYGALQSRYSRMSIFHGGCKLSINIMDPFISPDKGLETEALLFLYV